MAELSQESSSENGQSKKIRSRKLSSKVDLTAMVDLAFLLITFFMLTTTLNKSNAMDLILPESTGKPSPVDENRTLTILIGANDKTQCFMGKLEENDPKKIDLNLAELRKELAVRKKQAFAYSTSKGKPDQGLIVLIKPGKQSNYGNLVDILDEMAINNIETFAVADLDSKENALIKLP